MVSANYRSLWMSYYSKKQIKVDYDIYFVCKVSKVTLYGGESGKPVAELITVYTSVLNKPFLVGPGR